MSIPVSPRDQILNSLKSSLLLINGGADWNYQVNTVQVGIEITRNFNLSQLPLVMIDPKPNDQHATETFGAGTANRHHRRWPVEITAIVKPESDEDIRAAGERFLRDLTKQLATISPITVTGANGANQGAILILKTLMGPNNFERSENKVAIVGIDLDVIYLFVARDL